MLSGKSSFKIEVPYRLIETGPKGKKPLIIYLHGYKQNIKVFERLVGKSLHLSAYHLFIQGPYPIYDKGAKKKVEDWGRSWYLYDGRAKQFEKSLEITSEFIQEIIENLFSLIKVSRVCVLGYSMGGYLAGYFAMSRWRHVTEAIIIGARIKTELFEGNFDNFKHVKFLALHGLNDDTVMSAPQIKAVETLKRYNVNAEFIGLDEGHKINENYMLTAMNWLKNNGY